MEFHEVVDHMQEEEEAVIDAHREIIEVAFEKRLFKSPDCMHMLSLASSFIYDRCPVTVELGAMYAHNYATGSITAMIIESGF